MLKCDWMLEGEEVIERPEPLPDQPTHLFAYPDGQPEWMVGPPQDWPADWRKRFAKWTRQAKKKWRSADNEERYAYGPYSSGSEEESDESDESSDDELFGDIFNRLKRRKLVPFERRVVRKTEVIQVSPVKKADELRTLRTNLEQECEAKQEQVHSLAAVMVQLCENVRQTKQAIADMEELCDSNEYSQQQASTSKSFQN